MNLTAFRYLLAGARYMDSVLRRLPVASVPNIEALLNTRLAGKEDRRLETRKAIHTRKARYGESKMQRKTVDAKKKAGHDIEKENR